MSDEDLKIRFDTLEAMLMVLADQLMIGGVRPFTAKVKKVLAEMQKVENDVNKG